MTPQNPDTPRSQGVFRTIMKNTAFATIGTFAMKIINFLFSILVVRKLGDERFGQYSVIIAFVGLFQIFAEFGMTQYVMREIAQDSSKTRKLVWNLFAVRFLLAIFSTAGITFAAYLMGYEPLLILGIFLYTFTFYMASVLAPIQTTLTASERFDLLSAINIIGQLSFAFLGTVVLLSGFNFILLILVGVFSMVPQIGAGIWFLRLAGADLGRPSFDTHIWLEMLRKGLPFGMISLALTIALNIDSVMIKMFHSVEVVGWYSVSYHLVLSIVFLARGFRDAIVPTLSKAYVKDKGEVQNWYYRTVKIMTLISLPIAVGGAILSEDLIVILYTKEFLPSAASLRILVWDIPFLLYASFCGNLATVTRKEKGAARIYTLNAIFNVILNLVLIPRYSYIGASVVTVATDILSAFQFYLIFRGEFSLSGFRSILMRLVLSVSIMALVLIFLPAWNILILISISFLVYLGLILVMHVPDKEEIALLRKVFTKIGLLRN